MNDNRVNNKNFILWKKQALSKLDKSTKGSIDEKIYNLCELINNRDDMFTLSSCSGRVCLLNRVNFSKNKNIWLYITHNFAKFNEVKDTLEKVEDVEKIEFRQESTIIHICVRDLEVARTLMHVGKESGFNIVGIIALKTKVVVELICDAQISVPIYDKKLLIDFEYLNYLVDYANNLQKISWSAIEKLEKKMKKI